MAVVLVMLPSSAIVTRDGQAVLHVRPLSHLNGVLKRILGSSASVSHI